MAATHNAIYQMIPRDLGHIDKDWYDEARKAKALGCNMLYLCPYHPSVQEVVPIDYGNGKTYMKEDNGMYAIREPRELHPQHSNARATDKKFKDLKPGETNEQLNMADEAALKKFTAFVRNDLHMELMADLVVNHEAADSRRVRGTDPGHPGSEKWFKRTPEGAPVIVGYNDTSVEGTVRHPWSDIVQFDWDRMVKENGKDYADASAYMKDNVKHYVDMGFTHFRVDVPGLVPPRVLNDLFVEARKDIAEKYPGTEASPQSTVIVGETLGVPPRYTHARWDYTGEGFTHGMHSIAWVEDPAFPPPWLREESMKKYPNFAANFMGFPSSHDTATVLQHVLTHDHRDGFAPRLVEELKKKHKRLNYETGVGHDASILETYINSHSRESMTHAMGWAGINHPDAFKEAAAPMVRENPAQFAQEVYERYKKIAFLSDSVMLMAGEAEGRLERVQHHRHGPLPPQEKLYDLTKPFAEVNRVVRLVPERTTADNHMDMYFKRKLNDGQEVSGALRSRGGHMYVPMVPTDATGKPIHFGSEHQQNEYLNQMAMDLGLSGEKNITFIYDGKAHDVPISYDSERAHNVRIQQVRDHLPQMNNWMDIALTHPDDTLPELPKGLWDLCVEVSSGLPAGCNHEQMRVSNIEGIHTLQLNAYHGDKLLAVTGTPLEPVVLEKRPAYVQGLMRASGLPADHAVMARAGQTWIMTDHHLLLPQDELTVEPQPVGRLVESIRAAAHADQRTLEEQGDELAQAARIPLMPPVGETPRKPLPQHLTRIGTDSVHGSAGGSLGASL